jgi:hypothetical protein
MDNIAPYIWGKAGWTFLQCVVYSYPDKPDAKQKMTFSRFFSDLKDILPCERCRMQYDEILKKYPLNDKALSSKDALIDWFTNVRQETDKDVGKSISTKEGYKHQLLQDAKKKPNYMLIIWALIGAIVVLLLILGWKMTKT